MRFSALPQPDPAARSAPLLRSSVVFWVMATLLLAGGCGSKSALVKKDSIEPCSLVSAKTCSVPKSASEKSSVNGKFPPIPIDEDSPRVRRFIREFAYRDRVTMKTYMANAEKHMPMVMKVAEDHGLPKEIAYLFMLESGANPEARSPANAVGMWQFMPATARSYGLRVDSWVDERLDPVKSTKAAMLYLKDLYGMFGCWRLALSAYNSGENKLNKVLCQEDADEYEEICSSRRLKRETREFWPKFQAIAQISRNPEKYGFKPLHIAAYKRSSSAAPVEGSFALRTLAVAMSVEPNTLSHMNPALIRGVTPPDSHYSLRVPIGKRATLVSKLESIPEITKRSHIVHVVSRGDSVRKIIRRYHVTKDLLAALNPDVNLGRRLRRGTKIVVPASEKKNRRASKKGRRVSWLK